MDILEHLDLPKKAVLVCCGSGGVGKTTVASALAILFARTGKKTCVMTVDPARRLADALCVDQINNSPTTITVGGVSLDAVMLNARQTLDDLINKYAKTPTQAERILNNRVYNTLTSNIGGIQEYMAAEKLYELYNEFDYDLIVLDTPPSREALDFLDAPTKISRFLGNKLFRMMLMPTRAYLRAVGFATQALVKTLSNIAGAELVGEAISFFRDLDGIEKGFKDRALEVTSLLGGNSTSFIVIAAPKTGPISEAEFLAAEIVSRRMRFPMAIINRVTPEFEFLGAMDLFESAPKIKRYLQDFQRVNSHERALIADFSKKIRKPVISVAELGGDIQSIDSLLKLVSLLEGATIEEPI